MAISYMNTTEIENIANDMSSLVDEFNHEINSLFKRFSEVPSVTGEWIGDQADFYFSKIATEKKTYSDFGNELKKVANELRMSASLMNDRIERNKRDEII